MLHGFVLLSIEVMNILLSPKFQLMN